jgi:integrase
MEAAMPPARHGAGVSVPVLDENDEPVAALGPRGLPVRDDAGNPVPAMQAKYTGLHALRHFFCSWMAAPRKDGGLELPLKTAQVRMGHSTLAMTADTYGHLWPTADDAGELAAAERVFMGA